MPAAVAIEGLTIIRRGRHRARSADDARPYLHYQTAAYRLEDLEQLLPLLHAIRARKAECLAVQREITRRRRGARILSLAAYRRYLNRFPHKPAA